MTYQHLQPPPTPRHPRKFDTTDKLAPTSIAKDDHHAMDSSAHTVGVAALVLGMLAAFSLTKGAAEKEERPASTREPSPARDGEVCFRITKRVSWHEQVFVHYVEPLEVQQIVSPELMLEGIVQEISQITGDEGMRVVSRQLAVTKREMAQKISRFSSEHGHSIDGYEKVSGALWDCWVWNEFRYRSRSMSNAACSDVTCCQ